MPLLAQQRFREGANLDVVLGKRILPMSLAESSGTGGAVSLAAPASAQGRMIEMLAPVPTSLWMRTVPP
jgi:hypothetical protein